MTEDRPGLPSVAAQRQHDAYMLLVAHHRNRLRTAGALAVGLIVALVGLLLGLALGWVPR